MNNIIEINDFNAPELDVYARTSEVQLRRYNEPAPGFFIAESPKVTSAHVMQAMSRFPFWSSTKTLKARQKNFWHVFRRSLYIQQNMKSL